MTRDDDYEFLGQRIRELYQISDSLNERFRGMERRFTLDGHLLGSIGEVLAALAFDLVLESPSSKGFDARTKDGKQVQIKFTAVNSGISLYSGAEFLIALHLKDDGIEVLYNGPGDVVYEHCRGQQKNGQRRISLSSLRQLSKSSAEGIPVVRQFPKILRRE